MRKTLLAAGIITLSVAIAPACATKGFVREEVGAVNTKVDTLGGTVEHATVLVPPGTKPQPGGRRLTMRHVPRRNATRRPSRSQPVDFGPSLAAVVAEPPMATPSLYVLADPLTGSANLFARKGDVIGGKYRVGRLIARGGMGKVYRAEQAALGDLLTSVTAPARAGELRGEAAALAAFLNHGNGSIGVFWRAQPLRIGVHRAVQGLQEGNELGDLLLAQVEGLELGVTGWGLWRGVVVIEDLLESGELAGMHKRAALGYVPE